MAEIIESSVPVSIAAKIGDRLLAVAKNAFFISCINFPLLFYQSCASNGQRSILSIAAFSRSFPNSICR